MKRKKEEAWVVPSLLSGIGEKFVSLNLFGKASSAPAPSPSLPVPPLQPPWEHAPSPSTRTVFELPPVPSSSSHPSFSDDSDSDSDETAYRPLRVVALPRNWREKFPSEALSHASSLGLAPTANKELRRWRRRQWECIPVVVKPIESPPSPPPRPVPATGTRAPAPRPLHLAGSASPANPQRWSMSSALSGAGSSPERMRRVEKRSASPPLPSVPREEDLLFETRTPGTGESWKDAKVLPEIGVGMLGEQSDEELRPEGVEQKTVVEVDEGKEEENERESDGGEGAEDLTTLELGTKDAEEEEPVEGAEAISDDATSEVADSVDDQPDSLEEFEDVKDDEASSEEDVLEAVEIMSAHKGKGKELAM